MVLPRDCEQPGKKPCISLVVWDSGTDAGYQLSGETEQVEESAFLNGYLPEWEGARPLPQTRRRLTVRVIKLLAFSRAPHTDEVD